MLEEERMLQIISQLEQYSFYGKNLEELMPSIKKKIELCDYMSAYEDLRKQIEKLAEL